MYDIAWLGDKWKALSSHGALQADTHNRRIGIVKGLDRTVANFSIISMAVLLGKF
jgi:hypothetical protein